MNYFLYRIFFSFTLLASIAHGMEQADKRRKADIGQVVSKLRNAVEEKNTNRAQELIQELTEAHQLVPSNCNPLLLHYAAVNNDLLMLELLLDYGFPIYENKQSLTPLHSAIKYCEGYDAQYATVKYLVERGAPVYAHEGLPYDPFVHCAIQHSKGKAGVVRLLLKNGANVQEPDARHKSPLHHAVKKEYPEIVATLLYFGAVHNCKNDIGNTPLHIAGFQRSAQTTSALLVSPQGGPEVATDEMRLCQGGAALFVLWLGKEIEMPRNIRKIICALAVPEPNQLIKWVPLRDLPYYAQFYNTNQKKDLCTALITRHVQTINTILGRHNRQGFIPDIKKTVFFSLKPKIREQYEKLLETVD